MAVKDAVMDAPVPIKVPPQVPLYHFHCAPLPNEPPFTESVTVAPALTVVCDADVAVGAVLRVLMVSTRVAVLSQPAALSVW